ncbi:tRNA lysidine(34) synthetase TilS [Proteinivorax hydrogeniformans]|uniref:tRNA(Ile)-lysidine synthase n=1 Tax=Proteinivorax hydrogeniformans TaxID=1826727 RepID=A0AAU8HTD9_9FIRM
MLQVIDRFLDNNNISRKKVVVAVSGGPDSIALLYLLNELKDKHNLKLHIAHLDHSLREEAVKDSLFVKDVAQSLDLPYTIEKRFVCQKGSIQQSARQERFEFLKDVCAQNGSDTVFLGQHKDDQLETIMMNFFRGSSLWGLGGIRPVNNYGQIKLIRPLLDFTKREILSYLRKHSISFREDESNKSTKYKRNKFRLEIIPFIEKQVGPHVKNVVTENSRQWQLEGAYFKKKAEEIIYKAHVKHDFFPINLDVSVIRGNDKALWSWVLVSALERLLGQIQDYSFSHLNELANLISYDRATSLQLPNKVTAIRWDNYISLIKDEKLPQSMGIIKVEENLGEAVLPLFNKKVEISKTFKGKPEHQLDGSLVKAPLFIRTRKKGDYFYLNKQGGKKKVKDFMIDEKIPKILRDLIPILVDADDNILAILGKRTNGRFKSDSNCKNKLNIYIKGMEEQ